MNMLTRRRKIHRRPLPSESQDATHAERPRQGENPQKPRSHPNPARTGRGDRQSRHQQHGEPRIKNGVSGFFKIFNSPTPNKKPVTTGIPEGMPVFFSRRAHSSDRNFKNIYLHHLVSKCFAIQNCILYCNHQSLSSKHSNP